MKSKIEEVRNKMSSRLSKVLSLLLGVQMFMFGVLKFFQPFHEWFDTQIQQSHLPHEAILAGKLTEMLTGALFLLPWVWRSLTAKSKDQILLTACFILFTQMGVATLFWIQLYPPLSRVLRHYREWGNQRWKILVQLPPVGGFASGL